LMGTKILSISLEMERSTFMVKIFYFVTSKGV